MVKGTNYMTSNPLPSLNSLNFPGAINEVGKNTLSNIYTSKIHLMKGLHKRQVYSCCKTTMASFFLNMYKENSKGFWVSVNAFLPNTLFPPCSGQSGGNMLCKCDPPRRIDLLRPPPVPIFWGPRICFLAASGPVVEAYWQFSPNTRALSLFFFLGLDFPLHLSASVNAKYWKVQIDFPSRNMKGLFFKLQYFLRKYLWSICARIKEKLQTPLSDCQ